MKTLFLIFVLYTSSLFAQVGAPDLRCLEVMANGNVKLSWIPPTDPSNQFSSYEVYFSLSRLGQYTLSSSGLTAIATNSFVHTTTVALIQSCYYYMVSRSGAGGTAISSSSDTLRTISAGTFTGNVSLDIKFNHIHNPKLPSSSAAYVINKEYPLGTWNILASTSGTVYPDTINVCDAKINYQISLSDASGCVSTSNLIIGEFRDTKPPERPYVDSISVLPNGHTVLAWQIPVDKDIEKYNIQYAVGGTNVFIDSVMGRNSTQYTYTTPSANLSSQGVFVQAVDSCGKGGTVDYAVRTLFLQTSYNRCAYQSTLKWNSYTWSSFKGTTPESTLEYRVYYSVEGSPFSIAGTTSDTSFVHSNVAPGKNICYFVRVINTRRTVTASSNRTCFFSDQPLAPQFVYIKTASVKDESAIEIKLYLDNAIPSNGMRILRAENDTSYTEIGFIPYTGAADYVFLDENVDPATKTYAYKAFISDSCGNLRAPSNVSRTMLLKVNQEQNSLFERQLNWSEYTGFSGGVSGYNIYRVVNDDLNTSPIGSTDALTREYRDNLEDVASQGARISYVIEAVEGIANTYGLLEKSYSNAVAVYIEGNLYVPNAFVPDGLNKVWRPVTHFIEKEEYQVSVFNRWGKKVFETRDDAQGWDGADCPAGVYVYLIDYKNARGEYKQLKGTLSLLR